MEDLKKLFCMLRGSVLPFKGYKHEVVYTATPFDNGYMVSGTFRSQKQFNFEFMLCNENGTAFDGLEKTPAEDAVKEEDPAHVLVSEDVISAFGLADNYYVASAVCALLDLTPRDKAVNTAITFLQRYR